MASSLFSKTVKSSLQLAHLNQSPPSSQKRGHIVVLGRKNRSQLLRLLKNQPHPWQLEKSDIIWCLDIPKGPCWVINLWSDTRLSSAPKGVNDVSEYAATKDYLGQAYASALLEKCDAVEVSFVDSSYEALMGGLVGIEMGSYRYKSFANTRSQTPPLYLNQLGERITSKQVTQASAMGVAVNVARHLVNLPASYLTPPTYTSLVQSLFRRKSHMQVEVWREDRLKEEGMGLLVGVGQGAEHKSCMVCIKYRPLGAEGKPIAFVGKGITFDTGGLDLKPAAAMRLMKKDMGGSSSVVGLAYWACHSGIKKNLDFYIALAENSVSANSMRPGDVLTARNGMAVEIHHTDAEGRLALADVLDVAVTQKEKPRCVVDVATLTGAMKVALGPEVGGIFGNHQPLIDGIYNSSLLSGDLMWPMPLIANYRSKLNSTFADIQNCSEGFGGAVTAALFLESFVRKTPWIHLDIYAWSDTPKGALQEVGGSGQAIQCLAHWLQRA